MTILSGDNRVAEAVFTRYPHGEAQVRDRKALADEAAR